MRAFGCLFAAVALAAGCIAYTPVVPATVSPKLEAAYLTGIYVDTTTALSESITIGVTYENVDTGVIHTFKFERERQFQALEVQPGTYRVKQLFMASMFNQPLVRGVPRHPFFQRQVKAAAGQAYFLGHYTAYGTITQSYNQTAYGTQMQPLRIVPTAADQRAFAEKYPNLGKLPLVRGYE